MSDSTFVIFGTAQVGQTLSALPNYTYQWFRSGVAISGATSQTYTPIAADVGHTLSATKASASMSTPVIVTGGAGAFDFSKASNSGLVALLAA